VYHPPDELFVIEEIIPSEVIKEVEKHPDKEAGLKLITELLADQASDFDLRMDTIQPSEQEIDPNDLDEMLVRYAGRLGAQESKEVYDLVLVATGDNTIAESLARVNNVYIVGPEDLKAPSGLRGRLAGLVNAGRQDKVTIEDGA
jgi:rRNA-processing protein FCF1